MTDQTGKPFYCRKCNKTAPPGSNGRLPHGWYSVARAWSDSYTGMVKLGLFCSVLCLDEFLSNLYEDEVLHPSDAVELPA